jgi:hypothetical protein
MSRKTLASLGVGSGLVLIAALAIGSQVQAGPAAPARGMQMTETQVKDHCKDMMEQKKKLAADVESQDAELTELVAKMNRAPGDKQMTLMAAAITQIVEHQAAMDQRKATMEDAMMAHMMQHMQMGKDSMGQCPMMKDMNDRKGMAPMPGMMGADDKPAGAQKMQQEQRP